MTRPEFQWDNFLQLCGGGSLEEHMEPITNSCASDRQRFGISPPPPCFSKLYKHIVEKKFTEKN